VYGGTPPDAGVTNENVYTVAHATPTPPGAVPIAPARTGGMGIVVVDVVVDVVWVMVTMPSVWVGDPVHPADIEASRREIDSRLRTDI